MTEGTKNSSARLENNGSDRAAAYKPSTHSRLYHRLDEALHSGSEVWFRMPGTRIVGIPIFLDTEYVEVVDVDVAEGFEEEDLPEDPYQRTVWLIRLEEISAISYATDRWSKERFERLLEKSHHRIESHADDSEAESSEAESSEDSKQDKRAE